MRKESMLGRIFRIVISNLFGLLVYFLIALFGERVLSIKLSTEVMILTFSLILAYMALLDIKIIKGKI